jgi:hypothetical protein
MSIFGHTKDVINLLSTWVANGTQMTWRAWTLAGTSLSIYTTTGTGPAPGVAPATQLVCWERPLLALFVSGWADTDALH